MRRRNASPARRLVPVVIGLAILGSLWIGDQVSRGGGGPAWLQFLFGDSGGAGGLRVGIVAGHRGNDSGAVCPDGLTEAEINAQVADLVAQALRLQGLQVDVMDEFDRRLKGCRADAFVSIHSDSCMVQLSGFKVAHREGGSEASARLATCLWDRYEAATGLPRHPDTITANMTRYHAFRLIAPSTPAAIIELGFLSGDRELLTQQQARVADGVVSGVLCSLEPSP